MAALEKEVWGYTDAEDVVPPPVLIVSVEARRHPARRVRRRRRDEGVRLFDPRGEGRAAHAVVAHARRDARRARRRAGAAAEAGAARARRSRWASISIEWTYDPLQALNAHLNFTKLGVVVEEYEENIYGESSSPLHSGSPTDRFVAEWRLNAPHVERRIDGRRPRLVRDASVARGAAGESVAAGRALAGAGPGRSVARRAAAAGRDSGRRRRAAARRSGAGARVAARHARDLPALLRARLPRRRLLPVARRQGGGTICWRG